ncbi:hypothetical protein D5045_21585 [Verminephrobacter eiseniae]|uniref:hypothetical protein n=1 Tax=Verminephrobacter eiseniae TaxID=364317 RepID=UPI00223897CE|nr:hypothetical protein [Verminephrobacter eiseniae]MCW5262645.1 hypothetical protein [Verminephrobacter eiseniae]
MSRHRSSVGLRWPSKRIAALHRLPIRSVLAARFALRCAPMAACSLRHLIGDATLAAVAVSRPTPEIFIMRLASLHQPLPTSEQSLQNLGYPLSGGYTARANVATV